MRAYFLPIYFSYTLTNILQHTILVHSHPNSMLGSFIRLHVSVLYRVVPPNFQNTRISYALTMVKRSPEFCPREVISEWAYLQTPYIHVCMSYMEISLSLSLFLSLSLPPPPPPPLSQQLAFYTCHVSGPGLQSATANHPTHVIVELTNSSNRPCSVPQNVSAQLELISKATPTSSGWWLWSKNEQNTKPPAVHATVATTSPSRYEVSYTAISRGQHKLHV